MRLMADRYVRLLAAAVAAPRTRGGRPAAARRDRAAPRRAEPAGEPLPNRDLGRAGPRTGAHATPDAIAAVRAGGPYADLPRTRRLADRLAARLGPHGAAVASCCHAGRTWSSPNSPCCRPAAAFLPLDPEHPAARIALMCRDAGCAPRSSTRRAPPPGACARYRVLAVPTPPRRRAAAEVSGPRWRPAYVMYTSGSTGRPKGVMIEHAARLASLIRWYPASAEIGPGTGSAGHRAGLRRDDQRHLARARLRRRRARRPDKDPAVTGPPARLARRHRITVVFMPARWPSRSWPLPRPACRTAAGCSRR